LVGPVIAPDLHRSICPYLGTGEGWRLAVPERAHRCLAVSPPTQLALDKQARVCLVPAHGGCATFLAASDAAEAGRAPAGGGDEARIETIRSTARRWPVARTQATVLDVGRGSIDIAAVARDRATTQVALVLLALLAFGALVLSRFAGAGPDQGGVRPSLLAVSASPSAAVAASPAFSGSPLASPIVTSVPSTDRSSAPVGGAGGNAAPSARTYTVRSGDTLLAIARRFATTVRAIRDANGIADPARLRIGQVLLIP
jgi:LysM repeat protein